MSYFWFLIIACHVLPVGLAIWGAFSRRPWIHAPAGLVLMSELAGFLIADGIIIDGMFPAGLAWFFLGPLFAPIELLQAVTEAPLLLVPLLCVAALTGVFAWGWLWRRTRRRTWTYAAALAAGITMWIAAEISVETMMRTQAAQIPGACDFHRTLAPQMLAQGLSDFGPAHGNLRDGNSTYLWSFKRIRWVEQQRCAPAEPFACLCHEQAMRLLQSPQRIDSP